MYISDVSKKGDIQNIAIQDLRGYGIKYRLKKAKSVQESKISRRVFKTALHLLPMQTVTLATGQQLVVPKLVDEMCSFIVSRITTEGLFRKGGSKARQNEIKLSLDAGCCINEEHHEVDIASMLKTFFRELPEPLIPYSFHELFLRCALLPKNRLDALFLTCLLLPAEHLNTLTYFMQFLHYVAEYSSMNKMDSYNLAVVIGPTLLPIDEKLAPNTAPRLAKICEIFKILIENAKDIGMLPDHIIQRVAHPSSLQSSTDEESITVKRKKKRRSGSLTRMFNGFKKMVGSKINDEITEQAVITPDLLITPHITRSIKKRKSQSSGLPNKKKRELLQILPQGSILGTPFTPVRTPVNSDPRMKKSHWNLGNKHKNSKQADTISTTSIRSNTKQLLERRWSAVTHATGLKKNKKRNSCEVVKTVSPQSLENYESPPKRLKVDSNEILCFKEDRNPHEVDYVKISKHEYEEIKTRVSAIEKRISLELDAVQSNTNKIEGCLNSPSDLIYKVQNAYEQTLEDAEPLCSTTDQLARRLSRELKIRKPSEHKIIRSPSARKIGTLRRRSRELERSNSKLISNQSFNKDKVELIPRINLKRGKPNTVLTGLPHPTPLKVDRDYAVAFPNKIFVDNAWSSPKANKSGDSSTLKRTTRTFSFHGSSTPTVLTKDARSFSNSQLSFNCSKISSTNSDQWTSGEMFFSGQDTTNYTNNLENCRASLIKLRNLNAGMVMKKAKLFDGKSDNNNVTNLWDSNESTVTLKGRKSDKIGNGKKSGRYLNQAAPTKNLDKKKKSMSPNKRSLKNAVSSTPQKLHKGVTDVKSTEKENEYQMDKTEITVFKHYNHSVGIPHTPTLKTTVPYIKTPLNMKSPKFLQYPPLTNSNKQSHLKVLAAHNV